MKSIDTHQAFLLGAGLGTRMRPFTLKTPKPILPILGVPLLTFLEKHLRECGFDRLIVNAHLHFNQMFNWAQSHQVECSDEQAQLLGSAGGYRHILSWAQGRPFLGVNGDNLCLPPYVELMNQHERLKKQHGVEMTLLLLEQTPNSSQTQAYREILGDDQGFVTGFSENPIQGAPFFSGVGFYEPSVFSHLADQQPADFVQDVLIKKIKERRVGYLKASFFWLDLGHPAGWISAHQELARLHNQGRIPQSWAQLLAAPEFSYQLNQKNIQYHSAPFAQEAAIHLQNRLRLFEEASIQSIHFQGETWSVSEQN